MFSGLLQSLTTRLGDGPSRRGVVAGALAGVLGLNMLMAPLAPSAAAAPVPLPLPRASVNNTAVIEPNAGFVNALFRVTLNAPRPYQVRVNYVTQNGSALAGPDYVAKAGQVIFPPGSTLQFVNVQVRGDLLDEFNETFNLRLVGAINATILDGLGVATIIDNDAAPRLSISNASKVEGNFGTSDMVFRVSLSAPSGKPVSVNYQTFDGTAKSTGLALLRDYNAASGTVHFAPGQTVKFITVKIVGNLIPEPTEHFVVRLSGPVNATIADGSGTGTIFDNDRIILPF